LIAQYVAPALKNGIAVTLATPTRIAPCGPAASTVSSMAL